SRARRWPSRRSRPAGMSSPRSRAVSPGRSRNTSSPGSATSRPDHRHDKGPCMADIANIAAVVKDGVGTITFDRLDRRNALSVALMTELSDQLDAWAYDDEVA